MPFAFKTDNVIYSEKQSNYQRYFCQVENVSVFKLECQRKKIQQYRQRYQHATHIANKHIKRNYEHQILEFMRNRKEFRTQQRISEASNNIGRTDRTRKIKFSMVTYNKRKFGKLLIIKYTWTFSN